jgi:hypothetical protein
MDSRHRNWSEMFVANRDQFGPELQMLDTSTRASSSRVKPAAVVPSPVTPAAQLELLWAQSVELRERALQVRAVSMEVRAMARDMRLRRAEA